MFGSKRAGSLKAYVETVPVEGHRRQDQGDFTPKVEKSANLRIEIIPQNALGWQSSRSRYQWDLEVGLRFTDRPPVLHLHL
jgi:hypothetical protein